MRGEKTFEGKKNPILQRENLQSQRTKVQGSKDRKGRRGG